jgi:hypothetical protein
MRKILLKTVLFVFLLVPARVWAQDQIIPEDSIEFQNFLVLQKEVQGLSFRFHLSEKTLSDSLLADSLYSFVKTDLGFESTTFPDFSLIRDLESPLLKDSLNYRIDYVIFSQVSDLNATREYLSNLVRNGDYRLKFEEEKPQVDLVLLASRAPYSPFLKYKLKFIADYKLFGVTVVIIFFFAVALSMIVMMLVMKARKTNTENLEKEYDKLIIGPLTSLLFEKELEEITSMKKADFYPYFPQSYLAKPLYNDVMIDRIIGLNKKMKGEFKDKLKALYRQLGLDLISRNSLKSKNWDRVTEGLVQINEMDLKEALPEVKKHVNSANFYVRSQAVATVLNLSEDVDLAFLRDQTFPLSLWQQMTYLRIIKYLSNQKELKLEVLFDSKNKSIRIFGYKLMKMLGRMDFIESLSKRAYDLEDDEKIEVLEVFGAFGAHTEAAFINSCLTSGKTGLVLAAATTAGSIGDQRSVEILLDLLNSEVSYAEKQVFLRSLHELSQAKFEEYTQSNSDSQIMEIRAHLLDPLLQNV